MNKWRVRLAQLGWLTIFLLIMSLLLINTPHLFRETFSEWQVMAARRAALTLFTTIENFVWFIVLLKGLTVLVYVATALFLAWHRWKDSFVLFVSATLLMLGFQFGFNVDVESIRYPYWLVVTIPAIKAVVPSLSVICLLLLFYLFPNGRFTPYWTAWLLLPATALILFFFGVTFFPDWYGLFSKFLAEDQGWAVFSLSLLLTAAIGLILQVIRYHNAANNSQRQQTRWVILGLGIFLSTPVISLLFDWLIIGNDSLGHFIILVLSFLLTTLLPLTITFSILRYRLWEIDLFINRTLVYGGLTLLVTAVYILTVGLMSSFFQSGSSLALSVLATGLIAILFNPVRQRLQTAVNRLMYGERDDPVTILTTLGKRLAETAVPTETLPALVEIIAQTLKLPYVAIVGSGGAEEQTFAERSQRRGRPVLSEAQGGVGEILVEYPSPLAPHPSLLAFPLIYQSETIGQLLVAPRAPGETFNPAEQRLLENVARQAGTAVYAAQLTRDLQRSRERLVTTREEERRRIHRDLHDGLGPQLATLSLKVDAARNYLARDPETADHLLGELKSEIQSAINDIRRLVHDLRPPALDQLGLISALQEYVAGHNGHGRPNNQGLTITLTAPDSLPPLPAAIEVAVYRIALEALTNTMRHAQAQSCQLCLQINDGLHLEICDDGHGLPVGYRAGIGLSSMRERTAELGGTFHIESTPGCGTVILVTLPFNSTQ